MSTIIEKGAKVETSCKHRFPRDFYEVSLIIGVLSGLGLCAMGMSLLGGGEGEISKSNQKILSFIPAVFGVAILVFTLLKRKHSRVFSELASAFFVLGMYTSFSQWDQLFYLEIGQWKLLLVCCMLALACLYALKSASSIIILIVLANNWFRLRGNYGVDVNIYYLLLHLAAIPALKRVVSFQGYTWATFLLGWVFAFIVPGNVVRMTYLHSFMTFVLLLTLMYLLSKWFLDRNKYMIAKPMQAIVTFAVFFIPVIIVNFGAGQLLNMADTLAGAFRNPEPGVVNETMFITLLGGDGYDTNGLLGNTSVDWKATLFSYTLIALLIAGCIALIRRLKQKQVVYNRMVPLFPVAILLAIALACSWVEWYRVANAVLYIYSLLFVLSLLFQGVNRTNIYYTVTAWAMLIIYGACWYVGGLSSSVSTGMVLLGLAIISLFLSYFTWLRQREHEESVN